MKSFTAVAVFGIIATLHAQSHTGSSLSSAPAVTVALASSAAIVPTASKSAPYPSNMKGATQIADGQIQIATGVAKSTGGVAKSTTAPKSGNSTVPFTGAGSQLVAPVGGFLAALAAAVAAF